MKYKYPRTFHTPWSLGATSDDKVHKNLDFFNGKEVVVTVKMDGENFTGYRDGCHARSLDGRHHPSRDWVKSFWSTISYNIPAGWRVCGENLYAKHAIAYSDLPSYLLAFSVWDELNWCLHWDETVSFCEHRGIEMVPVVYTGIWDEAVIEALFHKVISEGQEGIVIRTHGGFAYEDFSSNVAKAVRAGHVNEEDTHWMFKEIVPNGVREIKS